jgi:aryl-alcohol dehydrogenase-like predicted oxidoreductase
VVPIPGTKRMSFLEENVAAMTIELSPLEVQLLGAAMPASEVVGHRYGEKAARLLPPQSG